MLLFKGKCTLPQLLAKLAAKEVSPEQADRDDSASASTSEKKDKKGKGKRKNDSAEDDYGDDATGQVKLDSKSESSATCFGCRPPSGTSFVRATRTDAFLLAVIPFATLPSLQSLPTCGRSFSPCSSRPTSSRSTRPNSYLRATSSSLGERRSSMTSRRSRDSSGRRRRRAGTRRTRRRTSACSRRGRSGQISRERSRSQGQCQLPAHRRRVLVLKEWLEQDGDRRQATGRATSSNH